MKHKTASRLAIDSEHEILIERMAHEGQGIGKINGLKIFVEGAMIGEKCRVKITKSKKHYAIAKIIEILKPSLDRITPKCMYANQCGGCHLQYMSYEAQLSFKTSKVKDSLKRIGHIDTEVYETLGMVEPWHYRNKSQYPVGRRNNNVVLGFYENRSHDIVDLENCLIQHSLIDKVMLTVKDWLEQYHISIYNELSHEGLIRHVVIKVGYKTGVVMAILVANGKEIPFIDRLVKMLGSKIQGFKCLILNVNTKKTNVIMGEENIVLYGRTYIYDYIGDVKFRISPLSFFQVNSIQMEALYKKTLEYAGLTGSETVIDLYCGIGTISLFLAKKAKRVYGIEVVSQAIDDARINAEINGIDNVGFIEGAAEKVMPKIAERGIKPDVIVVDPPRRGCDEKTLEAIARVSPDRVVYVSCNPATLARDLRYLEDRGYKTEEVQPVDMFPQTHHVECVIEIQKV
ncbi:MAG TPA: 23S rRNA (uracil(1939)-C(5))-methyltransferase RlmD [Thermoanaerobacterales bacterium]|jgi:23S rRNA (uracil1939-C5)-methyltransferase|nr:23S rRNA (uracil(1939)-C(5))-methyltransferase RlmD [Thermoanaerobacterales bacterium]